MSRTPATFKASDVTRAVNAVRAAGLEVTRTEITKDGRIVLVHTSVIDDVPDGRKNEQAPSNEWDEYIDAQAKG